MTVSDEADRCDRRAEQHLGQASRAASKVARIAHLNLASIFATQAEKIRLIKHGVRY